MQKQVCYAIHSTNSNSVPPPNPPQPMLPGALIGLGATVNQAENVSALRELTDSRISQRVQTCCVREPWGF